MSDDDMTAWGVEIVDVEATVEREIAMGCPQRSIALTYALAMRSSWPTDWKRVNTAILSKWPKGLSRVKELAWRIAEGKTRPSDKVR
jgi:hypothetical protein